MTNHSQNKRGGKRGVDVAPRVSFRPSGFSNKAMLPRSAHRVSQPQSIVTARQPHETGQPFLYPVLSFDKGSLPHHQRTGNLAAAPRGWRSFSGVV